jgi:hypothetical protein
MEMAMKLTTTRQTTVRDLAELGFDEREISQLRAFKASFDPFREFCESNQIFEQLNFMKWQIERGDYART